MDADLQFVVATLTGLDDGQLHALIETATSVPQTAPGLLAWIEGAADWELNPRRGFNYALPPPEAAIPPEEDADSLVATMMLRTPFAQDAPAVAALFDAMVGLLGGGEQRH
jgi:hypothetical protein